MGATRVYGSRTCLPSHRYGRPSYLSPHLSEKIRDTISPRTPVSLWSSASHDLVRRRHPPPERGYAFHVTPIIILEEQSDVGIAAVPEGKMDNVWKVVEPSK